MLSMSEFAKRVAGNKTPDYGNELSNEYDTVQGPWAWMDLPKLAAWLDHDGQPLAAVHTALPCDGDLCDQVVPPGCTANPRSGRSNRQPDSIDANRRRSRTLPQSQRPFP